MIDWNKRNGGFLSPESVYEDQLGNLSMQINQKDKEIERLKNGIKELDDMFYETFRISQNGYFSISEWELKDFTDKIKSLKEGENDE